MKLSRPAKAAFVGILVIVILGIASSMAKAQAQQCGPREDVLKLIAEKYGESPIFDGLTQTSNILVTVNSGTGTWSVLTLQGELACLRASGLSFKTMPVKPNI